MARLYVYREVQALYRSVASRTDDQLIDQYNNCRNKQDVNEASGNVR